VSASAKRVRLGQWLAGASQVGRCAGGVNAPNGTAVYKHGGEKGCCMLDDLLGMAGGIFDYKVVTANWADVGVMYGKHSGQTGEGKVQAWVKLGASKAIPMNVGFDVSNRQRCGNLR
jgi:hypothetical protein